MDLIHTCTLLALSKHVQGKTPTVHCTQYQVSNIQQPSLTHLAVPLYSQKWQSIIWRFCHKPGNLALQKMGYDVIINIA